MICNVKIAVYVPVYSATYKRYVMGDTPTYEHIKARFGELFDTLESQIVKGSEIDRAVRYRVIFNREKQLETAITAGSVIHVTHRIHPKTGGWTQLESPEQYIVHSATDEGIHGDVINLGLINKDQE